MVSINNTDTLSISPLRIALVGYGTMGQEIERLAEEYGCIVTQIYRRHTPLPAITEEFEARELYNTFDVAIDFSVPAIVQDNIQTLAHYGKHVVLGTTGWFSTKEQIAQLVHNAGIGVVWSANFSVGVQIFLRVVQAAAVLIEQYNEYDIALHELHHNRKADSPSGTAIVIAEILQEALSRKNALLMETSHGRIATDVLHTTSTRCGDIPGTHTVYVDSIADTIELTHRARNRTGFALGALRAARWIYGRQGFYNFNEIFPRLHEI
jgi:4-hydroxy-tetrahydrodipicolinate reductase